MDNEDFKLSVGAETEGEWNEFKDAMWRERTPTIDETMEAWERAGKPDDFHIITLASEARDSTGELQQFGVLALTYDEYKQYGWFRPTTAQIDWAFRDTAKITPEEQLKIWAEEHEAKIAQEEEWREEYNELRADPIGTTKSEKGVSTLLTDMQARQNIGVRRDRMEEIENLLGVGATEAEPDIVYGVIDGGAIQLQNDERSIEDCNKAIELNPNFIMAYNNRELALSKLEEKNSIPGFETVFAITGFLAVAYLFIRRKSG